MYSAVDSTRLRMDGFPIRKSPGQGLFGSYPRLIAAFHVLRRLLAPRHPPYALSSLTAFLIADGYRRPCGSGSPWNWRFQECATFRYSVVKERLGPLRGEPLSSIDYPGPTR